MSSSRWPTRSSVATLADLRHQDRVRPGVRGGVQIVGMPGRVEAVDADEHLAGAEAAGLHRVDDLLARLLLGLGRDRVLEIEDHAVDRQGARLFDGAGVRSRHVEHAAARTEGHGVASRSTTVAASQKLCQRGGQCVQGHRMLGLPASMAAPADGSRRSCVRQGAEARLRIVPRFADCWPRPRTPAVLRSTCRSACRNGSASAAAPPRTPSGRCSAPAQSSVFSVPSRESDLCRRLPRSLPDRADHLGPAAQGVEAAVQHRAAKSARSTRHCARPGRCRPGVRGASRTWRSGGSTATRALTEPKKVKSRPYDRPGLALRRALLLAAGSAA